jgi:hypothetical protein
MAKRKYFRTKILRCIPADNDEPLPDVPAGCYFSQETIDSLIKLGNVLRPIYNRLVSEGYSIIDGKLIAPDGSIKYEPKRRIQKCDQGN